MSTEQQWPDEAREDVLHVLSLYRHANLTVAVDAALDALAPYVVPRTDEWEWGLRDQVDMTVDVDPCWEQKHPRSYVLAVVVRRRSAGPWEVAPDA